MTAPILRAAALPSRRQSQTIRAAAGRSAISLTSAARPSATPATTRQRRESATTAPRAARPTRASLWAPLTTLITITGDSPRNTRAAGSTRRR